MLAAERLEPREDAELEGDVLGHGFDHEVGPRHCRVEIRGGTHPGQRLVLRGRRQLAPLDAFVEVLADPVHRAVERARDLVVDEGAKAAQGRGVGDAPAHEAGADHGHGLDPHALTPPLMSQPPSTTMVWPVM